MTWKAREGAILAEVAVWSPELDTLDQLCGGPLSLNVVAMIFSDDARCAHSLERMVDDGHVYLMTRDGELVQRWQLRELFQDREAWDRYTVNITTKGG
jgi:hypothetical protein